MAETFAQNFSTGLTDDGQGVVVPTSFAETYSDDGLLPADFVVTEPPPSIDMPVFVVPPFLGWDNLATVPFYINPNQVLPGQLPVDFYTPLGTPDYSGVPHDFPTATPSPDIGLTGGLANVSTEALSVIPEPSTTGLILLGCGLAMIYARFRKQNTRTV